MVITVKKKCKVDDGVMIVYKEKAIKALEAIYDNLNTSRAAAKYLSDRRGDVARLNDIAKGVSRPGRGIDLEKTRLRGIDFENITVENIHGKNYLVGHTRDMIMTTPGSRHRSEDYSPMRRYTHYGYEYDHGDYKVYVDIDTLGTPNISRLHFVPDLDAFTESRHYHHKADPKREMEHPVQMSPYTCWGNFAGPMAANLSYCDLPELFRMLRAFVGRYNPGSPLTTPRFGRGKI